jgi:hypothetical protein
MLVGAVLRPGSGGAGGGGIRRLPGRSCWGRRPSASRRRLVAAVKTFRDAPGTPSIRNRMTMAESARHAPASLVILPVAFLCVLAINLRRLPDPHGGPVADPPAACRRDASALGPDQIGSGHHPVRAWRRWPCCRFSAWLDRTGASRVPLIVALAASPRPPRSGGHRRSQAPMAGLLWSRWSPWGSPPASAGPPCRGLCRRRSPPEDQHGPAMGA